MKRLAVAFVFILIISCNKEDDQWITGTVVQDHGCFPNTWLVRVDNPSRLKYSFLCDPSAVTMSSWTNNCDNSVFIIDLPLHLRQTGTRIKFSKWEDKGLLCFSSIFAPHHLEVQDVSAK